MDQQGVPDVSLEQALNNIAKVLPELKLTWWEHLTVQRSFEVIKHAAECSQDKTTDNQK